MRELLDTASFVPLYHQLKQIIKNKIESGEWRPGERIPSENELRNTFSISRNTIQKALDELVNEGLLDRKQGRGTFVSKAKIEQSLTNFYSFSKVMANKGMKPQDIILSIETEHADLDVSRELHIEPKDEVIALRRVRKANEEPIILETSYLPKNLVPTLTQAELEHDSLYGTIANKYGIIVSKAKEIFEPVIVSEKESHYLDIKAGSPGLSLERIAYDNGGNPVEFCKSLVRGDRCRFYTELI